MGALLNPHTGNVGLPAFPSFPQFELVPIPDDVTLETLQARGRVLVEKVNPIRAWQGLIKPFESDAIAKKVLRLLAVDQSVDILGGAVYPPPEVGLIKHHPVEQRMQDTDIVFDILVLEFEPPAHPWAFSLNPVISNRLFPLHPHLRSDRSLKLPSRTLNGFCVYSSAEFTYDHTQPQLPQFFAQVSIFLAKHVIWLRSRQLFDARGKMIHDGVDATTLMENLPPMSIWQVHPEVTTNWKGFWPGSSAISGLKHLTLDPQGECWCGKGLRYIDCCLQRECAMYLK